MNTRERSVGIVVTLIFLTAGCVNSVPQFPVDSNATIDDFVYRGHNFGSGKNEDYRAGVKDGCLTSDGNYSKNHTRFNTSTDYRDGWEDGRLHCKGNSSSN